MSTIIVLGGGVVGLSTALLLTKQGHQVTVLERDTTPTPPSPDAAWSAWERRGVAQFRLPHYLHSAARELLDAHLPEVTASMVRDQCVRFDLTRLMPQTIADRAQRPGDERFVTLTGRRSTLEPAVATVADQQLTVAGGARPRLLLAGNQLARATPADTPGRAGRLGHARFRHAGDARDQ
jgi:glycine/D-amino acid oxidase-like deaminating enzyme